MPEVPSAPSCGSVAPIVVASPRECNTFFKVRLVQHCPLFANIPPADCQEIVSVASESEFSRRDIIFLGDARAERMLDGWAILPRHLLQKPYEEGKTAQLGALTMRPNQGAAGGSRSFSIKGITLPGND
jgi:hypothetical protein